MSDNDYVLLDQLIILRNESIVDIADLHDGEHDDVEGGVGAVEHLPLDAGAQGPHLLVNVLKCKNISKCKLFICCKTSQHPLTRRILEDLNSFSMTQTPFYLKNSLKIKKTCA